nr:hypothetical protein [Glycomyces paridis]
MRAAASNWRKRTTVASPAASLGASTGPSQVRAAVTRASTPVLSVGSITGAKCGEWFPGSASMFPDVKAASAVWVSRPPQNQNTVGAPAASPNTPTSSLAVTSGIGSIRSAKRALKAATVIAVDSGSETRSGALCVQVISGGLGAPEASLSALMIRSIAALTRSRTCGE